MPFTVQDLIEDNPTPVTGKPNEPVEVALHRMLEHDFSQLPVVNDEHVPLGIITTDSILRAQSNFGVALDRLCVSVAMVKAQEFRNDADLFELLDKLRDTYAALIVDGERKLIGIVTSYDTTEYFRRRAEDMMLVEDIESMLKEYILAAFTTPDIGLKEDSLNQAVQEILSLESDMHKKFKAALYHYLNLHSDHQIRITPNADLIKQVVTEKLQTHQTPKSFEELTMQEFITLFLHKSRWLYYESIFNIDREAIFRLLDGVRNTRNALAHFRGEISAVQRDQLRFCSDWLARYHDEIVKQYAELTDNINQYQTDLDEGINRAETEELYLDEELKPDESRYAALALWLQKQSAEKNTVPLTFEQIEEIIGSELPDSAYKHRSWWANDPITHVQSQQWLDADWRVYSINIGKQQVTFTRIAEREKLYIDFFSDVVDELRRADKIQITYDPPIGNNVQRVWLYYSDIRIGFFDLTFIRKQQLRLSFYIELGDKDKNKEVAQLLAHKDETLTNLSSKPVWERLDSNRSSRIVVYYDGAITDDELKLAELCQQAVQDLIELADVLREPLTQIIKTLQRNNDE